MVSVAHLADLHLDTPFSYLNPGEASVRRQELRDTFANAVKYAAEKGAAVMLLSGDLFDNEYASGQTAAFLSRVMGQYPDIRFFISPGNHDFLSDRSVYRLTPFTGNVHVFGGAVEKVDIPGTNITVYGFAALSPHSSQRMIKDFRVEDKSHINIMTAHMSITSRPDDEPYFPVTEQDIAESGLNYLALGHIHAYSGIKKAGKTYYAYPGCPEGRGFDEPGVKGMLAGKVGADRCDISFVPLSKRTHEIVPVDLTGVSDHHEAKIHIKKAVDDLSPKSLLKIVLTGQVKEDYLPEPLILKECCEEFFYHEFSDNTTTELNLSEIAAEHTLRGMFVKELHRLLEDTKDERQRRVIDRALRYGLKALADEEVPAIED